MRLELPVVHRKELMGSVLSCLVVIMDVLAMQQALVALLVSVLALCPASPV
jgi:hypothetical protein